MDSKKIVDALTGKIEWFEPGKGLTKEEFQGMMRVSHEITKGGWDCDEFTIAQEEFSELIQAVSKFKRYGRNPEVMINLHEEVGDALVFISHVIQSCELDEDIITEIMRFKTENLIRRDGHMTRPHEKDKGLSEWNSLRTDIIKSIRQKDMEVTDDENNKGND